MEQGYETPAQPGGVAAGHARSGTASPGSAALSFAAYDTLDHYDELIDEGGQPRPQARLLVEALGSLSGGELLARQGAAVRLFQRMGINFAVYGDDHGADRIFPFDIVPRIVAASEWDWIERGLTQRVRALNHFIGDMYHQQRAVRDGVVPAELIASARSFRQPCVGLEPPAGIWCHVTGTDLVRDRDGQIYVLEDNLRCPSGVSYVLQNRRAMKRSFPRLFESVAVRPVEDYPSRLLRVLESVAPPAVRAPTVVVLTPGVCNSAYYEHAFLAQQMGVELVEGQDLFVRDDQVFMRTTQGPRRVDVIYRRVDDDFLDPKYFRKDSMLGVPGLLDAYRAGRVTVSNAIGTGVADDKSIYPYVPEMIRFYLGEQPILNNVPTYMCRKPEDLAYTLAHLPELVVKEVHGAGGYGMLVGPASTAEQIETFRKYLVANPEKYIAQPTLALSNCPTFVESGIAPRHLDLRPFVLSGTEVQMVPGGLTRVALREGSLVVNSSQGGGTKDTWVLEA